MSKQSRTTLSVAMVIALAAVFTLPVSCVAGEKIDETRAVAADADIEISNVAGSVVVSGWDRREIHIEGVLGEGTERLDIDGDEHRLRIRVVVPKRMRGVEDTDLEIHLPATCQLEVATVSADIAVEQLTGELTLESVSGDIDLTVEAKEVDAETVSGEIDLQGGAAETILGSVSGDITIAGIPQAMIVDLEAETVSGDLIVEGATFRECRLNSVSGEIEFSGRLTESGDYTFSTHSGDIALELAGELNAKFDISTYSGEIESDFGPKRRSGRSKYRGTTELYFELGSGEADVDIETFSGDIVLEGR